MLLPDYIAILDIWFVFAKYSSEAAWKTQDFKIPASPEELGWFWTEPLSTKA